jgi:hypothetical protein
MSLSSQAAMKASVTSLFVQKNELVDSRARLFSAKDHASIIKIKNQTTIIRFT